MSALSVIIGLALVFGPLIGGGVWLARWARRSGRRPVVWVVGAYVTVSVALGLAQALIERQ